MKILYLFYSKKLPHGEWRKASFIQVSNMCSAFSGQPGIECILAIPSHLSAFFTDTYPFKIVFYKPYIQNPRINRFLNYYSLRKTIRQNEPDIIFSRDPVLLLPALFYKAKIVFEAHNNLLHNRNKLINAMLSGVIVRISKAPDFILFISISQALSEYWKSKGIPEKKMITLHDGFASHQFEKLPASQWSRKNLKLPLNQKLAMYAGSLYPDREITTILDLAADFKEVFFVIVGGPDKTADKIREIASERGLTNIHLSGYVPHDLIPGYLAAADILLALWSRKVITINYCSPMKLFEYMAAGKTIIAHDFPTIHEVLTDQSDSLLVNPDSYQDLKITFRKALENPDLDKLGERARTLAFEKYTWEKRVDAILTRIRNVSLL